MATEMSKPMFKRKQYLVAKKFQLKYVGIILLLMFLTATLCSYVVYYTSMMLMGEKLANVYPQGRLIHIVNLVNFRILLSVILVTPLVAVIGIFLSHRIAGPIYRIEKFLANMAEGDLSSRIFLRQGDELIVVANSINKLADSLESTVRNQKAQLGTISKELDQLKRSKPQEIAKLEGEINSLIKELERFKV